MYVRMHGWTDGHFRPALLGQLSRVDLKTAQFTTKCMGNRVIALKWQISLWQDFTQNVKHTLTSEVM